jgi:voltage-gated potassium channel
MLRKLIYDVLKRKDNKSESKYLISEYYGIFISVIAFLSVVPLMFTQTNFWLQMLDTVTVYILFADYVLRWMVNDYKTGKMGSSAKYAFIKYPFTPMALIDLFSLLPSLGLLPSAFRVLRMLRILKIAHYSKNLQYISNVFKKERKTLSSVLVIAIGYIFLSALVMFSNEPDTFHDFFGALYWATTALTTVGYGDVYPTTMIGRLISMISSLFGIAIIALPAGIVTAGFVDEINKDEKEAMMKKQAQELKRAEEQHQKDIEDIKAATRGEAVSNERDDQAE